MTLSIEQEQEIAEGLNSRLMVGMMAGATLGEMFPEIVASNVLRPMVDHYTESVAVVAAECGIDVPNADALAQMVHTLNTAFATAIAAGYAVGSVEALESLEQIQTLAGSLEAEAWADVLNGLVTDDDGFPITPDGDTESD